MSINISANAVANMLKMAEMYLDTTSKSQSSGADNSNGSTILAVSGDKISISEEAKALQAAQEQDNSQANSDNSENKSAVGGSGSGGGQDSGEDTDKEIQELETQLALLQAQLSAVLMRSSQGTSDVDGSEASTDSLKSQISALQSQINSKRVTAI